MLERDRANINKQKKAHKQKHNIQHYNAGIHIVVLNKIHQCNVMRCNAMAISFAPVLLPQQLLHTDAMRCDSIRFFDIGNENPHCICTFERSAVSFYCLR